MAISLLDNNDNNDEFQEKDEAIFRSAPMILVQFYVTIELARDMVGVLGDLGIVQFRDLNSKLTPFQRTFINEIKSIDSMIQQLNHLYSIMLKQNIMKKIDIYSHLKADTKPLPTISQMDELKVKLNNSYQKITQLENSFIHLEKQRLKLIEHRYTLNILNDFQNSDLIRSSFDEIDDETTSLTIDRLEQGIDVFEDEYNVLSGTISKEKIPILRTIIYRISKGNSYFNEVEIKEDDKINVFLIYVHSEILKNKIEKVIESLDGSIYIKGGASLPNINLSDLNTQIRDYENIVFTTKNQLIDELMFFQVNYADYLYTVKREKMIYETLNRFDEDSTRRCLVGEGWIPTSDFELIREKLHNLIRKKTRQLNRDSDETNSYSETETSFISIDHTTSDNELMAVVNQLSTNRVPPTLFRCNKFTQAFQNIIDAYGIATYQEVNPGLATIITFPFMFAIMFGDLGHGFIVLLAALFLIKNEISIGNMRNRDEIFDMAYNGRYILLLMGLFSMYTGLIYNDLFSKSVAIFPSGWKFNFENYKQGATMVAELVGVYPFGLDWIWHGTENNLLFTNSYKMKLSVLMGYTHMNYSLMFSLVNYLFFKSKVDIIGNFIPGILFMTSIFGYLSICIIYKWSVDWLKIGQQPPGLLNMLINMFLSPGTIEEPLYAGQKYIQIFLVCIALLCIPQMLIYKPLMLIRNRGYSQLRSYEIQLQEEERAIELEDEIQENDYAFPHEMILSTVDESHDESNVGDIVIHQIIHTIEFCLNGISHTASYLRLWALSLAHAQLSSVLWTMTIQNAFGKTGIVGTLATFFLFAMWFTLTVCILILMEGTSAMLHSLRLHWVEAMSKFFEGEGYAFEPFNFKSIDI
ncbi:unnamed protein product [Candida verbasci]|uniref:V-type proton ATPase subunit a n=1 Tax=Candida verbasci TaxID=1227364 RepID=A0A9W4XJ22_9ASCO|nr:unnamed protein product [Candida verbasci]